MSSVYFTYLIGWSQENKFYYGVRYAKNCNPSDLWTKYFTSSKYVMEFRQQYGEPDIIQVRKTFNNKEKARMWEEKVLRRIKIKSDTKWLNKTDTPMKLPILEGPCTETRRISIKNSRLKTKKKQCEFCGKFIDPGNFKQFHGEKCKMNPFIDKDILIKRSKTAKSRYEKQIINGNYHKPIALTGDYTCPHCNIQGNNYGSMMKNHYDNCNKNPESIYFNNNRKQTMKNIICTNCTKKTNSGNYYKLHFKKDHQEFVCIAVQKDDLFFP